MNLKLKLLVSFLLLLFVGLAWWGGYETRPVAPAKAADDYEAMMDRLHPLGIPKAEIVRCTDPRAQVQCKNGICTTSTEPDACLFYGGILGPVVHTATVTATVEATPEITGGEATPAPGPTAVAPSPTPPPFVPGANNLVYNGNFEYGFYQVPQLGFEIPDVGNVPNDWGWYRNPAYGKYNINNNQSLGIRCTDDLTAEAIQLAQQRQFEENEGFGPIPGLTSVPTPNNALMFQIQSSDQVDARLGVFQVVNVVPGQTYRFSMSGTIQIQEGAGTLQPVDPEAPREAQNHTVELSFDYRGGTDWKAIPFEERTIILWPESEVLFEDDDEDEEDGATADEDEEANEDDDDEVELSPIQSFETLVTARSNRLTIFIGAWRKWANWRSGYVTIDCVSLVPAGSGGVPLTGAGGGQPASAGQSGPGLPATGEDTRPNYIITGQGLMESPRFGRMGR